jgi:hypothetical protein
LFNLFTTTTNIFGTAPCNFFHHSLSYQNKDYLIQDTTSQTTFEVFCANMEVWNMARRPLLERDGDNEFIAPGHTLKVDDYINMIGTTLLCGSPEPEHDVRGSEVDGDNFKISVELKDDSITPEWCVSLNPTCATVSKPAKEWLNLPAGGTTNYFEYGGYLKSAPCRQDVHKVRFTLPSKSNGNGFVIDSEDWGDKKYVSSAIPIGCQQGGRFMHPTDCVKSRSLAGVAQVDLTGTAFAFPACSTNDNACDGCADSGGNRFNTYDAEG